MNRPPCNRYINCVDPPPAGIPATQNGAPPASNANFRPTVSGKFVYIGDRKFFIKGVTYGPFPPEEDGSEYHNHDVVERDFALMAAAGINSIRTYTVPPVWLLNLATQYRLRVMIGIPWEQHITFLDDRRTTAGIENRICAAVEACAGHPAVLCFSIGNEIPSAIVRWYGRKRIERLLERFYWAAKRCDPGALVTYVNYPSTEYLDLPFLDLLAFNVYLESPRTLSSYLARLQNLAGDRPLLMAEVGLDSIRHGEARQASVLEWQIRTAFTEGAAGLFVFSWTDEWYRGGQLIADWKFGLTCRERRPKPALTAVTDSFRRVPLSLSTPWPLATIVICSYNGAQTIRECLKAVNRLDYPRGRYEVIVVDDGSTDATASIASEFDVRLFSIRNGGLSNARNVGWRQARGEMVAYLDDDACPDPHWLAYLASGLVESDFAGIGGPNISPPDDGFVARCVDHSPGNPTHVLMDDREAEHLPGCNMAFWRRSIESVGGFDAAFRIAGDDVDFCWRLQEQGWRLGFSAAAVVWHHRRNTLKTYWSQQMNYGRAEAMLERKWPEKYNTIGHLSWSGRVYAKGVAGFSPWRRQRIYHGTWGTAPFQSIYNLAPHAWASMVAMPEWYLVVAVLGVATTAGIVYPPLLWAGLPLALALAASVANAICVVSRMCVRTPSRRRWDRFKHRVTIVALHLLQPAARLWGRVSCGLTPWRSRATTSFAPPWKRSAALWQEQWRSAEDRLKQLESALRDCGTIVRRGGHFDRWDLEIRGGFLSGARLLTTIEEHGQGKQLVRLRVWPARWRWMLLAMPPLLLLSVTPLNAAAWLLFVLPCTVLLARVVYEYGTAAGVAFHSFGVSSREGDCAAETDAPLERATNGANGHSAFGLHAHPAAFVPVPGAPAVAASPRDRIELPPEPANAGQVQDESGPDRTRGEL